MTELLNIEADNQAASDFLESYVQSGNLNFLFQSCRRFKRLIQR
jgi:hypothetical protein